MDFTVKLKADNRGNLYELDLKQLPFIPVRVMLIEGKQNVQRGSHAHHKTQQFFYLQGGAIQLRYSKDGENWLMVRLEKCYTFFHDKMEWLEIFFEKPSTLISFCSEQHSEDDYIRDLEVFKQLVKK